LERMENEDSENSEYEGDNEGMESTEEKSNKRGREDESEEENERPEKKIRQIYRKKRNLTPDSKRIRKEMIKKNKQELTLRKIIENREKGENEIKMYKEDEGMERLLQEYENMVNQEKNLVETYYKCAKMFKELMKEKIEKGMSKQTARKQIYDKIEERYGQGSRGAIKKRINRAEEIYEIMEECGGQKVLAIMKNITINELKNLSEEDKKAIREYQMNNE
jgi:uncharacterized UPF0160 family protein